MYTLYCSICKKFKGYSNIKSDSYICDKCHNVIKVINHMKIKNETYIL